MIDKNELLTNITILLKLANDRNMQQGVIVYKGAIEKISQAKSQEEIFICWDKLKHALVGIEAHGYLTNKEFEIVKNIRLMG
ncbi:hypothetical protein A1OO_11045 [Enterovibrio norvegicus FF-33]|uniref:Uncharacterized protein n=1 Tax=Enterovibrio norvegicus FF-454 TaxID=1185651 RepID=A0A1E5C7Z0_9GAMM|nr:hypothetical protein [Enterovibrio norvegicus]OEE61618.1 hypothetical protein A1OK_09685 [Enterovibrio norvegicus FF-454]OEE66318.1 hypothetical protein A1OO_11045 [Enterovibrio norvegicus FF-33]